MYEESCVHGAIANFLAGRFIKPYGRCVLTGEGADELFSGYDGQYKKAKNLEERAGIIDNLINVAHNTALQRLDRLNAANSYESRTPFLDAKVMDFALKIPLEVYGLLDSFLLKYSCYITDICLIHLERGYWASNR